MALYAIGDLHLCLSASKPMDIFGGAWVGYMDKLKEQWEELPPYFVTSSSSRLGRDEVLNYIDEINKSL